ncbi:MAG TPA: hypothetical protein VMW08_12840 [Acidimicrobiales bacterium]|nr:hypothetical protein [Acidimicrobiales bacterium]
MASFRRDDSDRGARAESASADPEIVVDLTPDAAVSRLKRLAHPSRVPAAVPCPRCGGPSDLDVIDLSGVAREQRCPGCGHSWKVDLSL